MGVEWDSVTDGCSVLTILQALEPRELGGFFNWWQVEGRCGGGGGEARGLVRGRGPKLSWAKHRHL